MKETVKSILRTAIGAVSGDTVRILSGPLRGRRLLRNHGLGMLSTLFGKYEPDFTAAFVGRISNASVIYDVGANMGYFSLMAAEQSQKDSVVVAFEPSPGVASDFREMVQANGLQSTIQMNELALSDSTGTVRLFTPGSDETGVIASALRGQAQADDHSVDVQTVTLDEFVFERGNLVPEVIKLDVEGAEGSVLAGATRVLKETNAVWLVEVHGQEPAEQIWTLAAEAGCTVRLLVNNKEILVSDRASWMENFSESRWQIQHCVLTPTRQTTAIAA